MAGRIRIRIETFEATNPGRHDYPFSPRLWRRAARVIDAYGVDPALDALDAKALMAVERGAIDTAVKFRDLMAAIHAIALDEPLPGDMVQ